MIINNIVLDQFFDDFISVRKLALKCEFKNIQNPIDQINYPDVCLEIPSEIITEMFIKISSLFGIPIDINATFLRYRKDNTRHSPHEVHSDKAMGKYTALIYLNEPEQEKGGTAFVEHISGNLKLHPETPEDIALWEQDTNDLSKWTKIGYCPMKSNRCVIFRADLLHYAEPLGGFGDNNEEGRLVLTCFFNV